jgi:hypothetical protein
MAHRFTRRTFFFSLLLGGAALAAALPLALPRAADGRNGGGAVEAAALVPAPSPGRVEAEPAPVLLPVHRWLKPLEYVWYDEGVPAGPVKVVVDIRARTLSVYRSGFEIGRSFITHGSPAKPTPLGLFPVLQKDADHVSNLYDAPMPFMLRLTWDGIAIHGGEIEDDIATRGCIGVPREFAELLFREAKLGTVVRIVPGPPEGTNYTAYAALPEQPRPLGP